MYRHGRSGRELSLLANGQGMLGGDVEVDCYSHDAKAYSLSGKPLVRLATTRSVKPFKAHKLNLPKTFVTRRGQMVLFTAPEDMIIGTSIGLHEREVTAQQAVEDLRTTGRLLESAMDYLTEDEFNTKHTACAQEMESSDPVLTQPGHFTKVYLNSLQKATENAQIAADCAVEDIEEGKDNDQECDSGLGQSTMSRLSASSKLSHDSPLIIPHGRDEIPPTEPDKNDILTTLKNEIHQQKNTSKTKKTTNKSNGKKRQRKQNSTDSPAPLKSKSKKSESKPVKSKRKRNKKDKQHDCHATETGPEVMAVSGGDQPITAINLPPSNNLRVEGAGGEGAWSTRVSRGEDRRREVERKRAEKRELEAAKRKEIEERLRLEEELAGANKIIVTVTDEKCDTVSMTSVNSDTLGESPEHTAAIPPLSNQARLRAELDRSRLSQQRWVLQGRDEEVGLEAELADADEALRRAREAAERTQQRLEEEERQQRLEEEQKRRQLAEQAELKEAAKLKAAEILRQSSIKPSSDNQKRLNSELSSQRHSKLFSNPSTLMFSYFNYVPTPKTKKEKKTRGRSVKAKTVKAL